VSPQKWFLCILKINVGNETYAVNLRKAEKRLLSVPSQAGFTVSGEYEQ
jgi:hypothetical protein